MGQVPPDMAFVEEEGSQPVVSQTALWCSASWLITKRERQRLDSTQHEMLRRIQGKKRRPDEDWVQWIIRATHSAKDAAEEAGIRFWSKAHLRSKFLWAGSVIRMDSQRLAKRVTECRDSTWWYQEQKLPSHLRQRRQHRTH
eukprot:5204791-Karenia_brevis.AAC.1